MIESVLACACWIAAGILWGWIVKLVNHRNWWRSWTKNTEIHKKNDKELRNVAKHKNDKLRENQEEKTSKYWSIDKNEQFNKKVKKKTHKNVELWWIKMKTQQKMNPNFGVKSPPSDKRWL